jgi:N-acetylmuramoyl-L-alanine amidase
LTIFLNSPQIWGYLAELDSIGNFILKIKKPPEPSLTKLKIALDPGHGGTDNGAIGPTRLLEKEANLAIALELAELLQNEGAKVFLTRSGDEQVELYQRLDKADSVAADFYISLHNNAHSDSVNPLIYHGMGVYYYQPKSLKLARFIHNRLLSTTKLPDDGFYYANFAAPRSTNMLSVLIETAFIIYPEEEILLKDTNFQRQTALGIYLGIKDFLKEAKREEKEYHSQ